MSDVAVKLYLRANGSRTHSPEEPCSGLWALFSFLGQKGGRGEKKEISLLFLAEQITESQPELV